VVEFNEVRIVSGSADSSVRIWDTTTGRQDFNLNHTFPVTSLQFDETKIISGGGSVVQIWDVRTGHSVVNINLGFGNVSKVKYLGNDLVINHTGQNLRHYDLRTNAHTHTLPVAQAFQLLANKELVMCDIHGNANLYNLSTGSLVHTFANHHGGIVTSLECDGERLVIAGAMGTTSLLKVWNYRSRAFQYHLQEHASPIHSIQMDERKIVSGAADNSLKVWDLTNGNRLYSLLGGTLQKRANNPEHPTKPGCSQLRFDEGRIVASFNSLLRVYSFEH